MTRVRARQQIRSLNRSVMSAASVVKVLVRKTRSAGVRLRRAIVSQRLGFSPSRVYDDSFYAGSACEQGREHAAAVAAVLHGRYAPASVFDYGCGHGALIEAFRGLGVEAAGCEGSVHGVRRCNPGGLVFQADLKRPVVMNRTFDLVTCIEVAEHMPARSGTTLVASIARAAAERIVFSASGPGEEGDDHINLRPMKYWTDLFSMHGYRENAEESLALRRALDEAGAPEWFQHTIMLERARPPDAR